MGSTNAWLFQGERRRICGTAALLALFESGNDYFIAESYDFL